MFEFDNDTKEKNFSSNLALVELLCLWFCTRSHFYSLKTMSQIKLCKMEIYATWRIVQTRTNNDFGNCTGTDFSFDTNKDIFLLSRIWLKANITYVNEHYDEFKGCEGSSNQKSLVCLLWKGQWATEVVAVHLWRKSATSLTNTQLLHAPILMILLGFSFSFSSGICVWVCNIPPAVWNCTNCKSEGGRFSFWWQYLTHVQLKWSL